MKKMISLVVLALFFGGCSNSSLNNGIDGLSKSLADFNKPASIKKYDSWLEEEKKKILTEDAGRVLFLYENTEPKYTKKKIDNYQEMKLVFEKTYSPIINYDYKNSSMAENKKMDNQIEVEIKVISNTINNLNNRFSKHGRSLGDVVNVSMNGAYSLCLKLGLNRENCNNANAANKGLSDWYYKEGTVASSHLTYMNELLGFLKTMKNSIGNYSIEKEKKEYWNKWSKKLGKKVNKFDTLYYSIFYRDFDIENTVYDLVNMEVFQSIRGGVILKTTNNYDSKLVFLKTNKQYVDGYKIKENEIYAVENGIKEYMTVLGSGKKIYSLIPVTPINWSGYFY